MNVEAKPNFSNVAGDSYNYYISEGNYFTAIDSKHTTMADYFTSKLTDVILSYNPAFSPQKAKSLARYGIFNDPNIQYDNDNERDRRKNLSTGTTCSP